jgi:hypothetical protein
MFVQVVSKEAKRIDTSSGGDHCVVFAQVDGQSHEAPGYARVTAALFCGQVCKVPRQDLLDLINADVGQEHFVRPAVILEAVVDGNDAKSVRTSG